jgi:hypothetical protein
MDQVSRLLVVPPPERLNLKANALQSTHGLLDLRLRAAMRELKWHGIVEKNFQNEKDSGEH